MKRHYASGLTNMIIYINMQPEIVLITLEAAQVTRTE
jgi:hypothetical protein